MIAKHSGRIKCGAAYDIAPEFRRGAGETGDSGIPDTQVHTVGRPDAG